ncbi:AAA family ATPase [Cupriavidus sp. AcVe19-1a]|uniref:AAA family ATPase n=1 Tax=Cupriavidus sp. AcVe19-1a TaxID=2821359 RepID=UPI001FD821A8|nr:AAA family ATPase [Cupriavidus sp. AcVe19-1a]
MRLDFVEVCGFRGFRDKLRVTFGSGFTVITGRNGVGKSTLFDAVEYALTGSIDKYMVEKAAQESLSDYLWWRGAGRADAHYVTASFKGDAGEVFTITRSRESGADKTATEIEAALCRNVRPDDALRQLCKTSIIRDEWIAALSVDLSETERFELVRGALGLGQGSDFGAKAKAVLKAAEAAHASRQDAYAEARNQLTRALTQLAEAKDAIARIGDASAAMQVLVDATPDAPQELVARLAAGRAALTTGRAQLGAIGEAIFQGREVLSLRRALETPEALAKRTEAQQRLAAATRSKEDAERVAAEANKALELEERGNDIAASLAAIIEHGERLGLHDAHCPLCAAERTDEEFANGLLLARQRMEVLASGVAAARKQATAAREAAARSSANFEQVRAAWEEMESELARQTAREQAHVEIFERNSLDFRFVQDPDGLEQYLNAERDRLIELERALLILEVSQSVAKTASLEEQVAVLRQVAETAASAVENSEKALVVAKAMDRGVRSISGEIIDERLAQISPLLNELYQRLRPHFDWRSIEYSIRGDVRRFLSLKVGDGLNPQFVFSSGQRRAAGLAFLLSVHLARAWTSWRTLLMDDPVQHIDDFRALHLIEVLAALRLGGRQVVCAVEDEALAELLCRRLLSTSESIGRRYDLDIGPNGATTVMLETEVPPMPTGVLRSRAAIQAVG